MRAIIMAGGRGTRLQPLTKAIPKPLVPIGDNQVIIGIIIRQLAKNGFDHITIAVNHLADLIKTYCGDGSRWGVKIDYSLEQQPLGTIGPLTLIKDLPENFLVINGDTLTDINYAKFLEEHIARKNAVSVSVKKREVKIDFGVVEFDAENRLIDFKEKPTQYAYVSLGVNCFNRAVIEKLPAQAPYGFDTLMHDGIRTGEKIWIYNFEGFWLDIGRPEDYRYVTENFESIKHLL